MIKKEELRIGNLVMVEDSMAKIIGLLVADALIRPLQPVNGLVVPIGYDTLAPVPLSSELFRGLGQGFFADNVRNEFYKVWSLGEHPTNDYKRVTMFAISDPNDKPHGMLWKTEVNYLHTLQNLIFIHTGTDADVSGLKVENVESNG